MGAKENGRVEKSGAEDKNFEFEGNGEKRLDEEVWPKRGEFLVIWESLACEG